MSQNFSVFLSMASFNSKETYVVVGNPGNELRHGSVQSLRRDWSAAFCHRYIRFFLILRQECCKTNTEGLTVRNAPRKIRGS